MEQTVEYAITHYSDVYYKLYKRRPSQLHAPGNGWIIINGARMQLKELEFLTAQLQHEYEQTFQKRRTMVGRLIRWFKQ